MTQACLSFWRWFLFACALAALVLLLWHAFFRVEQLVETAPVQRGRIEQAVTAPGTLQPQRYGEVGVQVSGQIRRIALAAGDVVWQGDWLRQKAQRQKMGSERDAVSVEIETAAADLRMVQALIASLKAQIDGARSTLSGNEALLGDTRIFAPMDGTVISLEARDGQALSATYQTPNLLRLADLSQMTVWTEVSEADMGRVKAGMPVYFTSLGLVDVGGKPRRWNGAVRQSARVFFVAAEADDVLLGPLAVLKPTGEADSYTAQVMEGEKVGQRSVPIGVRDRLNAAVLEGLNEGDLLVTDITEQRGNRRLRW